MNSDAIRIRSARIDDRDRVLAVHYDAFGDEDGPVIAGLVEAMLDDPTAEPVYAFVAESEDAIVGHVLFTAVRIAPDNQATGQILAPLAVGRTFQGQGIGSRLVKDALQQLAAANVELVFVLGYPAYYARFGFAPAGIRGFQAPYPIPPKNADAWMVSELKAGVMETTPGTVRCCAALDDPQYWVE